MGARYIEPLPEELAKVMVGVDYDPSCQYQLITEREGSYITAYRKDTGERVELYTHPDGITDDLPLDVEDFKFCHEEMERLQEDNDYTVKGFGKWLYIAIFAMVVCLSVTGYVCYVLLLKGG